MSAKPSFNLIRLNNTENNMTGGSSLNYDVFQTPSQSANLQQGSDEWYRYKARKYHMKIQQKVKQMQANGEHVDEKYMKYLQPFQG